MADDRRNAPIHRTGFILYPTATCPIVSGEEGFWLDSSASPYVLKWRKADATDVVVATTGTGAFYVAKTKTAAALPASTYDNGTAGVGAFLLADANGALGTVGGVLTADYAVGDVFLVDSQAAAEQNGIYTVTAKGAGGSKWKLTRLPAFDTAAEIVDGAIVAVQEGTFANILYEQVEEVVTVGTDAVNFSAAATAVTFAAVNAALLTANAAIQLKKETAHTLKVADSTTATAAGGALTVAAGKGKTSGAGGALALNSGEAEAGGGGNGGALSVDTGAKDGAGTDGAITIGATNANSVGIGRTGKTTTINGPLALAANAGVSASAGTGALTLGSMTGDTALPTGATSWAGANGKALALTSTAAGITIKSATSGTVLLDSAAALNLGTTDATSISIGKADVLTANVGYHQVRGVAAVTATVGGGTTGLIPAGASFVTVTSDNADKQISLPAASVGDRIRILVGATGCELISAVATHKVNDVVVGATNEAALTATNMYDCQYLATDTWIVIGYTKLGAVQAALVPDAL